jgi:hypothetical protein
MLPAVLLMLALLSTSQSVPPTCHCRPGSFGCKSIWFSAFTSSSTVTGRQLGRCSLRPGLTSSSLGLHNAACSPCVSCSFVSACAPAALMCSQ